LAKKQTNSQVHDNLSWRFGNQNSSLARAVHSFKRKNNHMFRIPGDGKKDKRRRAKQRHLAGVVKTAIIVF
jgi:hypothetical protein